MITALLLAQAIQASLTDVIAIDGSKHMLSVPLFVTKEATMAQWSPDGQLLYALTIQRPSRFEEPPKNPPKAKVVFWSTRQKKVVGQMELPPYLLRPEISWEGKGGSIILSAEVANGGQSSPALYRGTPNGRWEPLWVPSGTGYLAAMTSSKSNGVLLFFQASQDVDGPANGRKFYWLAPGAREGVEVLMPDPKAAVGVGQEWILPVYANGGEHMTRLMFSPETGFVALAKPPPPGPMPKCIVNDGQATARLDKRVTNFQSLWIIDTSLLTDKPPTSLPPFSTALVAPKATEGDFSTAGSAVFYIDEGNLFVRNLSKISDVELDLILAAQEKDQLVKECKQVGAALAIYLSEHDGIMPSAANLRDALKPLMKNIIDYTDGFVLSYRGPQNTREIKNNFTEIIGYKEGRFGRATVFADAHVKWDSIRK